MGRVESEMHRDHFPCDHMKRREELLGDRFDRCDRDDRFRMRGRHGLQGGRFDEMCDRHGMKCRHEMECKREMECKHGMEHKREMECRHGMEHKREMECRHGMECKREKRESECCW